MNAFPWLTRRYLNRLGPIYVHLSKHTRPGKYSKKSPTQVGGQALDRNIHQIVEVFNILVAFLQTPADCRAEHYIAPFLITIILKCVGASFEKQSSVLIVHQTHLSLVLTELFRERIRTFMHYISLC